MSQNITYEFYVEDEAIDAENEFYNVPDKRIIDMLVEACVELE